MENFKNLFIKELQDMYSSEHQIIRSLPKLIKAASAPQLKETLTNHLRETRNQVARLEKIFSILNLNYREEECEAMEGLIEEAEIILYQIGSKSPVMDAGIIMACQKIEHYEIASYGTLRSFAEQLELSRNIINLLQETLDEEEKADRKLTTIAIGSFFTTGVNKEAAKLMLETSPAGRIRKSRSAHVNSTRRTTTRASSTTRRRKALAAR